MSLVCGSAGRGFQILRVVSTRHLLHNSICSSSLLQAKHWNQKFRKLRSQKVIKVDLPDYEEASKPFSELSKEEIRSKMKEKGVLPQAEWMERPLFISSTGDIFEPYVPPEGDGKVSFITKEGAKQKMEFVEKKGKSLLAMRKLKKNDDDFDVDEFLVYAQDVYTKAHEALLKIREDKDEIQQYVTEKAYPELVHKALDKTVRWKMVGLLEDPRLVQVRVTDVIHKENLFAQLTVRFHTKQMLAVYDRFGRLMYGSEILAKDVLEYVVFEKHISNKYGTWRIHAKIIPDWMPPKAPAIKSYRITEDNPENTPTSDNKSHTAETSQQLPPPTDSPAIATT